MEQINENVVPQDVDLDLELEPTGQPAAGEVTKTEAEMLKSAIAQKKVWRERAVEPTSGKTYKELLEASKAAMTPPSTPAKKKDAEEDIRNDVEQLKQERDMRRFMTTHDLNDSEVEEVFAYAKGKGIDPKAALETPFFKKGLEATRKELSHGSAILSPSRRAPATMGGKTFAGMNDEERRNAYNNRSK